MQCFLFVFVPKQNKLDYFTPINPFAPQSVKDFSYE